VVAAEVPGARQGKAAELGRLPGCGPEGRRERRDQARKQLAEGADPSETRKAEKAATKAAALNTFKAVALAWMDHADTKWTDGTRAALLASLENHVFPLIGTKPVSAVRPADVRQLVQAVEATGARETAGRVFQRVRAIFRYAVAHELVDADPTYPLKPSEILRPQVVKHRAACQNGSCPRSVSAWPITTVTHRRVQPWSCWC